MVGERIERGYFQRLELAVLHPVLFIPVILRIGALWYSFLDGPKGPLPRPRTAE